MHILRQRGANMSYRVSTHRAFLVNISITVHRHDSAAPTVYSAPTWYAVVEIPSESVITPFYSSVQRPSCKILAPKVDIVLRVTCACISGTTANVTATSHSHVARPSIASFMNVCYLKSEARIVFR